MAAPFGNSNARKAKDWENAIRRALARADADHGRGLNHLADILVAKAAEGDMVALKEIGDRLDGKPAQTIAGDPDAPLQIQNITVEFVGATPRIGGGGGAPGTLPVSAFGGTGRTGSY